MEPEEQQRRKIILGTYLENPDLSHRAIDRKLGIVQSTVSRVLNRYNEDRGKKAVKMDLRIVKRITSR